MHPIDGREVGWASVSEPWEPRAKTCAGAAITLGDQLTRVVGDPACELGAGKGHLGLAGNEVRPEHRVANICREAGGRKILDHHAELPPQWSRSCNAHGRGNRRTVTDDGVTAARASTTGCSADLRCRRIKLPHRLAGSRRPLCGASWRLLE
jgi:hypothetical protein